MKMIDFWELSRVFILFGSVFQYGSKKCLKFGLISLTEWSFIKGKSKFVNKQIDPYKMAESRTERILHTGGILTRVF